MIKSLVRKSLSAFYLSGLSKCNSRCKACSVLLEKSAESRWASGPALVQMESMPELRFFFPIRSTIHMKWKHHESLSDSKPCCNRFQSFFFLRKEIAFFVVAVNGSYTTCKIDSENWVKTHAWLKCEHIILLLSEVDLSADLILEKYMKFTSICLYQVQSKKKTYVQVYQRSNQQIVDAKLPVNQN